MRRSPSDMDLTDDCANETVFMQQRSSKMAFLYDLQYTLCEFRAKLARAVQTRISFSKAEGHVLTIQRLHINHKISKFAESQQT